MPPVVRKIQNLEGKQVKGQDFNSSMVHSNLSLAHLSGPDGTLQGSLLFRQVGIGLLQPGQGGTVRMEVRLLIWWVEEPALRGRKSSRF